MAAKQSGTRCLSIVLVSCTLWAGVAPRDSSAASLYISHRPPPANIRPVPKPPGPLHADPRAPMRNELSAPSWQLSAAALSVLIPKEEPHTLSSNALIKALPEHRLLRDPWAPSIAFSPPPKTAVEQLLADGASASGGNFSIMHVTRVGDPVSSAMYKVESHDSPPKYMNTAVELVAEANRIGANTTARSVYIVVDGPTKDRDVRHLAMSLRFADPQVQTPLVVADETVLRMTSVLGVKGVLLPLGPASQDGAAFRQDAWFIGGGTSLTMTIRSASRSLTERFCLILKRLFGGEADYASLSILAIVQLARLQLTQETGLTLEAVDRELDVTVRNSQIAELPDAPLQISLAAVR